MQANQRTADAGRGHCEVERDVLVIGGGPAGTTAATLLARRGWTVTLLERDQHPRFHIGESLLPMNLPLLETLGVLEEVRAIGIRKPAADFTGRGRRDHQTFPFADSLGGSPDHAFQVVRSQFDALLFANCRRAGVVARENTRAERATALADGRHEVEATTSDGRRLVWRCRFLIDASGQDAVLARQQGWRRRDRRHSAGAYFAHYRGVPARPAPWSGNISIYWSANGWIWMIPLRGGLTSVGAVCSAEHIRRRRSDSEAFFAEVLESCPAAADRLADSERVTPVRAAANYSYVSRRQTGDGFALVGDAYTFVDPVFSSGVYLAMASASALAPAADAWLRGRRWQYRLAAFGYRRRIRRGVRAFKWFIYRFNTPAMAWLFENPRGFLKVERAVVSLLAGDVFDRPLIRARLWMFKTLFAVVTLLRPPGPGPASTND